MTLFVECPFCFQTNIEYSEDACVCKNCNTVFKDGWRNFNAFSALADIFFKTSECGKGAPGQKRLDLRSDIKEKTPLPPDVKVKAEDLHLLTDQLLIHIDDLAVILGVQRPIIQNMIRDNLLPRGTSKYNCPAIAVLKYLASINAVDQTTYEETSSDWQAIMSKS